MYFSIAVVLGALPFYVGAVSVQNSLRDVISIPLSKRSTFHKAGRVINTASFETSIHQTVAKYQRGFAAFKHSTGKAHPLAPKHRQLEKRSAGIVPLMNRDSSAMWSGKIFVGTPPKSFWVDFDTGSTDFFIPGPNCPTCEARHKYNPCESSTSKDLWTPFSASIIDGEVEGELFTDKVNVGGFEATDQTLGAASQFGPSFSTIYFESDGILGLALKEVSQFNATPVFETLVEQSQLQDPIFGFVLAKSNSELILGGRDTSRFRGNLTYVPVTVMAYWQTVIQGFKVNGKDVQVSNKDVIIDTGATQIVGAVADVANIYANIPGSALLAQSNSLWTVPCNTDVPVLINFSGTTFTISTYVLGQISGSENCLGGFAASSYNFWILGDVFLQNVYSEFDFEKQRIGFAPLA